MKAGIDPKKLTVVIFQSGSIGRTNPLGGYVDVAQSSVGGFIVLLVGFAAGLVARTRRAQKISESMEIKIPQKNPGYSQARGMIRSLAPEKKVRMPTVLVSLGYRNRLVLETDRTRKGDVAACFAGPPDALSGEVRIVKSDQVTPVDRSVSSVMEHAEQPGRKTGDTLTDLGREP